MWVILRILFTGAFIFALAKEAQVGDAPPRAEDLQPAFFLAVTVILAILTALVWAPVVGDRVSGPLSGMYHKGSVIAEDDRLSRWIRRLDNRRRRRLTLFFCFLQGLNRPWLPAPFVIGLRNSRPGSWLEKAFAREVLRFDNMQNALLAYQALKRQGITPAIDQRPELKVLVMGQERRTAPDRPPIAVPTAAPPPPPQRDPRIQLFDAANTPDEAKE